MNSAFDLPVRVFRPDERQLVVCPDAVSAQALCRSADVPADGMGAVLASGSGEMIALMVAEAPVIDAMAERPQPIAEMVENFGAAHVYVMVPAEAAVPVDKALSEAVASADVFVSVLSREVEAAA